VKVGDAIEARSVVGTVRTVLGEEIERTVAEDAGIVLFMTSVPAVLENGVLMGIGVDGAPLG
jgi:hypothetical protein